MAQGLNGLNEMNRAWGTLTHGHGWGWVESESQGEDRLHRSIGACWEDGSIESLHDRNVLLLHARLASQGAVNEGNVHPFQAMVNGRRWSYCHNGTVKQALHVPTTLKKPDCTDSEIVFHHLLPYLETDPLRGLRTIYGGIHDYSCLNSFLLGPDALWAVCMYATTPDYYTLHLSVSDHGPILSSEPLAEFGSHAPLANGQILRIDRMQGTIDRFLL